MSRSIRAQPFGSGFQSTPASCARKVAGSKFDHGENLARVRALNEIAKGRGQTLAQMALAWVLRNPRMTSTLVGASSVKQLEDNVAAVQRLEFSSDELAEIDRYAVESGVDCGPRRGRRLLFRRHFDLAHAACSGDRHSGRRA